MKKKIMMIENNDYDVKHCELVYNACMGEHYIEFEDGDYETGLRYAEVAEYAAERHFKHYGKKIYDPGYMGECKYITRVKEV